MSFEWNKCGRRRQIEEDERFYWIGNDENWIYNEINEKEEDKWGGWKIF